MRHRLFQGTVTTLLSLFAVYPASATHKVVNNAPKPLMAVQLTNSEGTPTARLYIVPKEEMVFGDDGWPVSGAGYIEAIEGRTYYVPFVWNGKNGETKFAGLRVERIEWDQAGRLVSVKGLKNVFESEPSMEISSDTTKPKVDDGVLHLMFKEKGDTEYKFKIVLGKIVSIEPSLWETKTPERRASWTIQAAKVVAQEALDNGTLVTVSLPVNDPRGPKGRTYVTPQSPFVVSKDGSPVFWKGWMDMSPKDDTPHLWQALNPGSIEIEIKTWKVGVGETVINTRAIKKTDISLKKVKSDRTIRYIDDNTAEVSLFFETKPEDVRTVGLIVYSEECTKELRDKGLELAEIKTWAEKETKAAAPANRPAGEVSITPATAKPPHRNARYSVENASFSGNSITEVKGTGEIEDEQGATIAKGNLVMVDGWIALQCPKGAKFNLLPKLDTDTQTRETWPKDANDKPAAVTLNQQQEWEVQDDNFFFLFDASYGLVVDFASSFARDTNLKVPYPTELALWGSKVTVGKDGGTIRVVHGKIVGGQNVSVTSPDGKVASYKNTQTKADEQSTTKPLKKEDEAAKTRAPANRPAGEVSITPTTAKPPHRNARYSTVKNLPKMDCPYWMSARGSMAGERVVKFEQPEGTELLEVMLVFANKAKKDQEVRIENVQLECNDKVIKPWETLLGNVYGDYELLAQRLHLSDQPPAEADLMVRCFFEGEFYCSLKPGQQMYAAFMFFVPKGSTDAKLKCNCPDARVIDVKL